jgi:uncharacterized membrane protein YecN with MAPEG domain
MSDLPTLPIVALYAGLNGLILLWLAAAISRVRRQTGIWIGDGGSEELIRAMRGLANFSEYVPLALLMLLLMAALGMPGSLVHLFGLILTAARLVHAMHFTGAASTLITRQVGATLTYGVVLFASLGLLVHSLLRLV